MSQQAKPTTSGGRSRRATWFRVGCWTGLAVLLLLALLLLLPRAPQHRLIRDQLYRYLTEQTGREVELGEVHGSLFGGVTVDGLRIAESEGFEATGSVVDVRSIELHWNFLKLLAGISDPLAAISSIRVREPDIKLRRTAEGVWELAELLQPDQPKPDKPLTFAGTVRIEDGRLLVIDETFPGPAPALERVIEPVNAFLDFDGHGVASFEAAVASAGLVELLTVKGGRLQLDPLQISGDLAATDLAMASLAEVVNPFLKQWAQLQGGSLPSLAGRIDLAVTDRQELEAGGLPFDLGLDLTAEANDVAVTVEALGKPIRSLTGQLGFTMVRRSAGGPSDQDRIRLEAVTAMVGGSRLRLDGQIIGFRSDRRYELTVASDHLLVGELSALLPGVGALASLRSDGESAASLRLLGALQDLRVVGWVEPDNVAWGDLGRLYSGRVRLDLQRVSPTDGLGGLTGQVEFLRVAARTRYLADTISQLTGGLRLGDDALAFRELQMLAGDAPLRVDGQITDLTVPRRSYALTVATEGLNPTILAPVMPAVLQPSASRGGITGRLSLNGPQSALTIAGELRLPWFRTPNLTHLGGRYAFDLRLGERPTGRLRIANAGLLVEALGGPLEGLDGTVVLRPNSALVQNLRGQFAGGPVRVDGTVALDGESFDLAVDTRGVRLERLDHLLRPRGIRGRGPLTADLRLRGGLSQFTVSGTAAVPYLAVPGTVIEGAKIVADLAVRPSGGLFGLTGTARLTDTRVRTDAVDAPLLIREGRFRFDAGRVAVSPLRGAVNGDAFTARGTLRFNGGRTTRLASLDLDVVADRLRGETVRRVAGDLAALDTVRIAAPLALDLHLSGSPSRLAITGVVDARRLVIRGDNPLTVAGRAGLKLRLRPGASPVGTVDLRGLDADLSNFDLPLRNVTGLLRLAADGRIHLGQSEGLGVRGQAGETAFAVRGSVRPGEPVQLDLGVTLQDLRLSDVRTALARLENPPEITGEGGLGRVQLRVVGRPDRLRIATVGDSGLLGGPMRLPGQLTVAGYRLEGGEAAFDLLLADGSLAEGSVDLTGVDLTVEETGTQVALDTGRLALVDGALELADLRATVGGTPVRVAGRTDADGELALRLAATEVPILELLPDAAGLRDSVESDRISTDLSVTGPLEDLAIAGTVALGGAPGVEPLTAEVHLRLVEPLDAPGEIDAARGRQILGGVRLTGGGIKLAALDEPIRDVIGEASFSASDVLLSGVEATIQESRIIANGSIYGLPEPVFDLRIDLPGTDLGALLYALRTAPAENPMGERVDFFTARGLPRLHTPEPVSGSLTVTGPREQVSVGVDLHLPVLTVDASAAMPDERGLGLDTAPGANPVLLRDAEITGAVVGSLAAAELPAGDELAAALNRLAGMELMPVDETAPTPPVAEAPPPSMLDSFVFGLHFRSDRIHPRQGFSFMSEEAKEGLLGTAYAFQPGTAELDLLGPLDSLQLKGGFDLPRLEVRGVPIRRLAARFDYFNNVMTLDQILLDIRGGAVTGHGAMALVADQPVDLELELGVDSLELAVLNTLPEAADRELELDGVLDGALQFHLARDVPRVQGSLSLAQVSINQERIGDGAVDFGFEKDLLVLRRVQLSEPISGAHAQAKGRVGLAKDGPIDLVADVKNFDLGRIAPLFSAGRDEDQPLLSGRLDLVGAVAGTRQVPLITGAANIFFGSIGGFPFHRLSVRSTETEPGSLRITGELSDAAYRGNAVALLEQIDFTTGELTYTVDFELDSIDLEQTLPLATAVGLDESFGEVHGAAHLTGRIEQQVDQGEVRLNPLVDLRGQVDLAAGDAEQPARLQIAGLQLDTARLQLNAHDDLIEVVALEVTRADTRIGIAPGRVNRITGLSDQPQVELHLVSDELHYEDLVSLTRLPLQTEGYLMVSADLSGPLRDPVIEARIRAEDFKLNGEEIGDRLIRARMAKGLAAIDGPQRFDLFGTRLTLGGQIDQDRINAGIDLEIEDFERLRAFLVSLTQPVGERRRLPWQERLRSTLAGIPGPLEGDFSARLALAGPRAGLTGSLTASGRGLHAGERPLPPVEVMIDIGRGTGAEPARFEPGVVYLTGAVELGGAEGGDLRLQARTDAFALAPYAAWSEGLDRLSGQVSMRATATGSTNSPVIELVDLTAREVGARDINLAEFKIAGLTLRPGRLELGEITATDGSLQARLTGTMQTAGLSPLPRDDGRVELQLAANVARLEEFRHIVPAIGEVSGAAQVELNFRGTPRALVTNGAVEVDLPTLEIVHRATATAPFHRAGLTRQLETAADVVAEVLTPDTAPGEPVAVLYQLVDNQIRLRLENNVILFDRFYFGAVPPSDGQRMAPNAVARRGEFEILEKGRIVLPRTLDLRRLARGQNLLENPIELQLRARDFAGRAGPVGFGDLDLAIDITPVFDGEILNQILVREGHGWFNGGYLRLAGSVGLRSPNLGEWPEHLYDLTLRTPAVSPDSLTPPANAASPLGRDGGLIYPLGIRDRRVGEAQVMVDLALGTRLGQTPPLTLSGRVEVFDGEIREGILAAFAIRREGGEARPWPASPLLDVTVVATENNWIRTGVPSLQLPVRGLIRLSETPQRLKAAGTAELGQGQLDASFLKAPIDIRGGSGQFTLRRNPSSGAFEPYANFSAKAETVLTSPLGGGDYERYQVGLDVSGSAKPGTDRPVDTAFVIRAESNPPLAEEQIFAMLSRRAEFGEALESGELGSFLQGELAGIALQTALSYALTPVFEELRKAFGLDVFTVRYELDRPLEIQASKYLLERLYLTLIVEVGGESGTKQVVKVDYEVAGGLRFGVQFDTDRDYRLTGEYRTRF